MTDEFEEEHFEEKPFLEHLEDLRMTLLKIIVASIAGFLVCLAVSQQIFRILQAPIGYSPLTGRYALVIPERGAPSPAETEPSQTEAAQTEEPKPSAHSPEPGTRVILTGPLTGLIMLAHDLFIYSREGLSVLNRYARELDTSQANPSPEKHGDPSKLAAQSKSEGSSPEKKPRPAKPPVGVRASESYGDKVRVSWNASSGATSYEVWRSNRKKSRSASRIARVKGTSYDDTSASVGKTHYYWVKAKNSYGTSGFSSPSAGRRLPTVRIIETGPTKVFIVLIKTTFICGLGLTFPLNLFFLAQFVFPALTRKEKKYVTPFFMIGGVLFVIGLLFGYFLTLPLALRIFVGLNVRYGIESAWRMSEYLGTVSKLLIANGVIFEMPLFLTLLVRIGILSVATLRKKRRHAIVILFILGAMLTPPDAPTMFMVAVPMLLMYEACIWVSWLLMRKKRKREKEEEEREGYWEERKRIRRAEKIKPEEKKEAPDEQPPQQDDYASPPEDYGEDYQYEDQGGPEEPPDEGEPRQDDLGAEPPPPDDRPKPDGDEEKPDRRDD